MKVKYTIELLCVSVKSDILIKYKNMDVYFVFRNLHNTLKVRFTRTDYRKLSFFPRTIPYKNGLPKTVELTVLAAWKLKLPPTSVPSK